MNGKIILSISFKLFAIYLCANVLVSLPQVWFMYLNVPEASSSWVFHLLISITSILVAIIVSFQLFKVANSAIRDMPNTDSNNNSKEVDLESILYRILGMFFIVTAISSLPFHLISINKYLNLSNDVSVFGDSPVIYIWSPLVQLTFGLFLTFRANGFKNMIRKLRSVGI